MALIAMSGPLDSQRGSEAEEQAMRTVKNHNYLQNIGNYQLGANRKEWQAYEQLSFGRTAESHSAGIPSVYEYGLVTLAEGVHTYISMQLLGQDIRTWASHRIRLRSDFMLRATGMLNAVEYLHSNNIVHRDIKLANFCTGADSRANKVFVVDFGFASHVPTKERANLDQNYGHMAFGGTPDYASRDALRGLRSSRKDDLESLGYCFLEMLQGDLPWYLTLKPDENRTESGQTRWLHMSLHDGGAYSQEQLCQMAETRETMWLKLCAQNKIPEFLIRWQTHVRSLTMFDKPSYGYLKDLLQLAPAPSQPTEQDTEPSVSTDAEPTAAEAAVPTKAKRSRPSSVAEDAADVKKQKIETHAPEE